MKYLLIADAFPPARTSAAVILHELACELARQGHLITVLVPSSKIKKHYDFASNDQFKLVSVLTPRTDGVGYLRRTLAEFIAPFIVFYQIRKTSFLNEDFDGIIWYSPSIFFGPLVSRLKKNFGCQAYLILRDMFPEWAVDLGLMRKGVAYYLFKLIEFYQYKTADHIGIQAPGNYKYFDHGYLLRFRKKVQVLWNWVTPTSRDIQCSININHTPLADRILFVYAGNMGIAQDFDLIMKLVRLYKDRREIGFVFVGRGSEVFRLKHLAEKSELDNIIFFDEINSIEIPALYGQCDIGLIALDPRHKSNNIPGKFLSYIESGLPVLARLNPGNDLADLIHANAVGSFYDGYDPLIFKNISDDLINLIKKDQNISIRCKSLAHSLFSTEVAAKQITRAFESGH